MSIALTYEISQPSETWNSFQINLGLSYFSISVSLNVVLTLMIVTRLILHSKNVRNAMGAATTVTGLYKTIVTMLIESSALYAASFLLYIGPWGANSDISDIFFPILAEIQVRAWCLHYPPQSLGTVV
jgi:hypothetical protein